MIEKKPNHWFKPVHEAGDYFSKEFISEEPKNIEFLKIWTGETYIHTLGTAFWNPKETRLDIKAMMACGITHYRLRYDL